MYKKARHAEHILAVNTALAVTHIGSSVGLKVPQLLIERQAVLVKALPGVFEALCDMTAAFHFGTRRDLEENFEFLQPIHYITFYKDCEDGKRRYWAYRRTSKIGEDRLAGNGSVGWGGHPELRDLVQHYDDNMEPTSVPNIYHTLAAAATREMREEVKFVTKFPDGTTGLNEVTLRRIDPTYFILDRSNPVGSVHLALSTLLPIPPDSEHRVGEPDEHIDQGLLTAEELLSGDIPLENWTRLVLMAEQGQMVDNITHWKEAPVKVPNASVSGKMVSLVQPLLAGKAHGLIEDMIRAPSRFSIRDDRLYYTFADRGESLVGMLGTVTDEVGNTHDVVRKELSNTLALDPFSPTVDGSRTAMFQGHLKPPLYNK